MRLGPVVVSVQDLGAVTGFYDSLLGLDTEIDTDTGTARVLSDGRELLVLLEDATEPRPPGSAGLYHVAFLLSSREALADTAARLHEADAVTGAADHLVSEAVYSRDPEGNGVEVYVDRPRSDWERTSEGVRINTLSLDLPSLIEEEDGSPSRSHPATVGHVHLEVENLDASEGFYTSFGLERRASGNGVRFLAADGYHHHVAINIWSSVDRPVTEDSAGVVGFGLEGAESEEDPDGIRVFDPDNQTVY